MIQLFCGMVKGGDGDAAYSRYPREQQTIFPTPSSSSRSQVQQQASHARPMSRNQSLSQNSHAPPTPSATPTSSPPLPSVHQMESGSLVHTLQSKRLKTSYAFVALMRAAATAQSTAATAARRGSMAAAAEGQHRPDGWGGQGEIGWG